MSVSLARPTKFVQDKHTFEHTNVHTHIHTHLLCHLDVFGVIHELLRLHHPQKDNVHTHTHILTHTFFAISMYLA